MGTLEDIEQQEKELNIAEAQSNLVISQKIPQRRYGFGVTKEQQQTVVSNKEIGRKNLQKIKEHRAYLEETRKEYFRRLEEEKAIAEENARIEKRNKQASMRTVEEVRANKEYAKSFQSVPSVQPVKEKPAEVKIKALPKELGGGISVEVRGQPKSGFRINTGEKGGYRYVEAGGEFYSIPPTVPTGETTTAYKNIITGEKISSAQQPSPLYAPIVVSKFTGEKVGEVIEFQPKRGRAVLGDIIPIPYLKKIPLKKEAEEILLGKTGKKFIGVGVPFTPAFVSAQSIQSYITKNSYKIAKATSIQERIFYPKKISNALINTKAFTYRTGAVMIPTTPTGVAQTGGFVALTEFGVVTRLPALSYATYTGVKGAFNSKLTPEERTASGLVGVGAGFGVGADIMKIVNKPIRVSITPAIEEFRSSAKTIMVKQGSKLKTVGEFGVVGVKAPRFSLEIKRWDLLRNELLGNIREIPKELQITEIPKLQTYFSTAKIKLYSEPTMSISRTEPFYINKEGWITKPVRKGGLRFVGVDIRKITPSKSSTYFGKLEGFTEPKEHNINLVKKDLEAIPKKAFEQIETLYNKQGIKVIEQFPREAKLSLGEIKTTELFRINAKGNIVPVKIGRRTTRGALVGVRNEIKKIEYPREFGLKEITTYREKVGFVDISLPKFQPRKGFLIEGISKEYFVELPSKETGMIQSWMGGGKKSSEQYLKSLYKSPEIKSEQIVSVALKQSAIMKTPPINVPVKEIVSPVSKYAGLGLYERTEGGMMPPFIRQGVISKQYAPTTYEKSITETIQKPIQRETAKEILRGIQRSMEKLIVKSMERLIVKPMERLQEKTITKQVQRQTQRQTQRLIQKEITRLNVRPTTLVPFTTFTPSKTPPKIPPLIRLKGSSGMGSFVTGYKSFITKKGKKIYLKGIFPKGLALRRGEVSALSSLRATFGVKPTRKKVQGMNFNFTPSSNLFRSYRIKKGKRIPLKDTYIQRLGKRLSFAGEKAEIQQARRMKGIRL